MYLSKFQLFNYKSFLDSGLLEFTPAINIVVGQNNAGKTALLEALTLNFYDVPHRSIKTLPSNSSNVNLKSKVNITFNFDKQELRSLIDSYLLPILILPVRIQNEGEVSYSSEKAVELFTKWLNTSDVVELKLSLFSVNYGRIDPKNSELAFGIYNPALIVDNDDTRYRTAIIKQTPEDDIFLYNEVDASISDTIFEKLLNFFCARIYRFYAERLNVGICNFGNNYDLLPNASNLAEVLNSLQGRNPKRFERFNQYVSIIFPHIKRITLQPRPNNQVEIMVWTADPETEREDLAISLSSCGTGIGQVLAILYVVMNSQEPRTIIIDEPQSFLHPGAVRKLIEILKDFSQHQYIIATHSSTIISAANPDKIVMLKYEECETKLSVIDAKETTKLRILLAEVGVSLSDVFGADNILWVEGPTEERCFPLILQKVAKIPLRGTNILAVKNTGDLDGKRAELIFDIYDKLSGGTSLCPPAIGFLFDSEGKPQNKLSDLKKRSTRPVEFLPRRMYENYLLHPEAIANVINEDDENREQPLTNQEVEEWLNQQRQKGSCLPKGIEVRGLLQDE